MKKGLLRSEGGLVYAEFILAFIPYFLIFLGTIQVAFIAAAGLVVQNAANKGVRAAAVVLDDDPYFYDGEDRLLLDFNGEAGDDGWVNRVGEKLTGNGGVDWLQACRNPVQKTVNGKSQEMCCDDNGNNCTSARTNQLGGFETKGGPRLRAIRRAAYMPLSTISPEWSTLVSWLPMTDLWTGGTIPDRYSIRKTGIGESPGWRFVTGFLAYNPIAAAVNFPTTPGSDTLKNARGGQVRYEADDSVVIRVTYLFPCAVPIVNMMICDSLLGMTGVEDSLESLRDLRDSPTTQDLETLQQDLAEVWRAQRDKGRAFRKLFNELQLGVENPRLQMALFLAPMARFHVFQREASLPIQSAPFKYPTEEEED